MDKQIKHLSSYSMILQNKIKLGARNKDADTITKNDLHVPKYLKKKKKKKDSCISPSKLKTQSTISI